MFFNSSWSPSGSCGSWSRVNQLTRSRSLLLTPDSGIIPPMGLNILNIKVTFLASVGTRRHQDTKRVRSTVVCSIAFDRQATVNVNIRTSRLLTYVRSNSLRPLFIVSSNPQFQSLRFYQNPTIASVEDRRFEKFCYFPTLLQFSKNKFRSKSLSR